MNRRLSLLVLLFFLVCSSINAQKGSYVDSLQKFQQKYVDSHEVVKNDDKKFLQFFPIDSSLRVLCTFTPSKDAKWFAMRTTGNSSKPFRKFGVLSFKIHDTLCQLSVYQSQSLMMSKEYSTYLFIPFTDNTSGKESYGGGRYLDQHMGDIRNNKIWLDFNKAYNPYCAYAAGYNCPIPPVENDLQVSVRAGEKAYQKHF